MNKVEFRHHIARYPKPVGDIVTLSAEITTPQGICFLVAFHDKSTAEGYDSVELRRIDDEGKAEPSSWFHDQHEDDMFASELFGSLTGKYPYEVKETIKEEVTLHSRIPPVATL